MFRQVGNLWNTRDIEIISDDERYFALDGWNGSRYWECWEVADKNGFDSINPKELYNFGIVNVEIGEDEYDVVGYEEGVESYVITLDELKKRVNEAKVDIQKNPSNRNIEEYQRLESLYLDCKARALENLEPDFEI